MHDPNRYCSSAEQQDRDQNLQNRQTGSAFSIFVGTHSYCDCCWESSTMSVFERPRETANRLFFQS